MRWWLGILAFLTLVGCGTGVVPSAIGTAATTEPPATAARPASPTGDCQSASLKIVNDTGKVVGATLNDQWTASVAANSTRAIVPDGPDDPPALAWSAAITDSTGSLLRRFVVQPTIDFEVTVSSDGKIHTTAALRVQCPPPTPFDYAGLPSNACGGFHLKILNDSSGNATISINETWQTTIQSGGSQVINEAFSNPQPPLLPWHVTVTYAGRQPIFSGTLGDTPVDQKLTLSDNAPPVQMPYDLSEDC